MAEKKLKVTLVKSTIGAVPKNKKTIEALGLSKLYKQLSCRIMQRPQERFARLHHM